MIKNNSFQNGRMKAEQEINNKFPILNVTRTMSKTQVRQKTREGAEVVRGDLDTARNGAHIELRLSSGRVITVQIEGE